MVSLFVATVLAADAGVDAPADFIDDVRVVFQVVTCQGGALPATLDAKVVGAYCQRMTPKF
ncbi:MAG: hypothetical protein MUC96_24735, partial [Myxococcaceae bacterium]|nr:hypothetical protein [Myxococcaceae bacterium]